MRERCFAARTVLGDLEVSRTSLPMPRTVRYIIIFLLIILPIIVAIVAALKGLA